MPHNHKRMSRCDTVSASHGCRDASKRWWETEAARGLAGKSDRNRKNGNVSSDKRAKQKRFEGTISSSAEEIMAYGLTSVREVRNAGKPSRPLFLLWFTMKLQTRPFAPEKASHNICSVRGLKQSFNNRRCRNDRNINCRISWDVKKNNFFF